MESLGEVQKIASVTVENILKVKFAHIEFKDDVVVIGGENGAGKSSIARAIFMAFAGKKGVPADPVRHGATEGKVRVELDGDFVLQMTVQPNRDCKVELLDKEGGSYGRNSQRRLDEFNARYGFYPQDFIEAEGKAQVDMLLTITGLAEQLAKLDRERTSVFERRTDVNRDADKAKKRLADLKFHEGVPEEEVNSGHLTATIFDAQEVVNKRSELLNRSWSDGNQAQLKRNEVERLKQQIAQLEQEAARCDERAAASKLEAEAMELPDIETLQNELREVEQTNRKVRENAAYLQAKREADEHAAKSKELTERITGIDEKKRVLVAEAKYPVEGLGFNEHGVTLNDVPFEQASEAQQWKAAVAIGFAMKPQLRLVYVRRGSLLTPKTREMVYNLTREQGGQLLFEIAGDAPDVTVVMEDGEVAEVREPRAVYTPEVEVPNVQ